MYQTMEIYMARKKQVPEHYNPNSNRIFDSEVGDTSLGDSLMNKTYINRKNPPPPPHPREPDRRNCPHPWHSRFLRHNVRWLNEPICVMATESTDPQQNIWWPAESSEEKLKVPPKTLNTVQRSDFQHSAPVRGNTRHSSNPFTIPSKGILPVNAPKTKDDPGDTLLERISYNHGYNSRLERSEPIRGKLHGSFVWNEVAETEEGKVVVTPWNKRLLHRCITVPVTKQDLKMKSNGQKSKGHEKVSGTPEKVEYKQDERNAKNTNDDVAAKLNEIPNSGSDNSDKKEQSKSQKAEIIPAIDGLPAPSGA